LIERQYVTKLNERRCGLDSSVSSAADVLEKPLSSIKAGHLIMAGYLSVKEGMLSVHFIAQFSTMT
jgi:hypothetical protein